ncbi:MAG: HAD-IIB family hydrolase [Sulfolobales archaeon]
MVIVKRVGVFFDFDGTLSPLDVGRNEAGIRDELVKALKHISTKYLIAVASSKDCYFLLNKAPYFHSYICVNGLEILTDNYLLCDSSLTKKHLLNAMSYVKTLAMKLSGVDLEEKNSLTNILIGLSIDWRRSNKIPNELNEIILIARNSGLNVIEYELNPFIDIYISDKNKGDAIKTLKSLLGLDRVIYLGDGENDIPAFKVSDQSVLVRHKYNTDLKVEVDYEVPYEKLHRWLFNEL